MAELVRVLHAMDTEKATTVVEGLAERDTPLMWEVDGTRRVLNPGLSMRDETLLVLHASDDPVSESDLISWLEHSNASVYRRDVCFASSVASG